MGRHVDDHARERAVIVLESFAYGEGAGQATRTTEEEVGHRQLVGTTSAELCLSSVTMESRDQLGRGNLCVPHLETSSESRNWRLMPRSKSTYT